jgi:hypothetical protein
MRESPGLLLSFVLMVTALIYLVVQRRRILWGMDFLAFLIMIGFGIVVLASNNREIRFAFPAIVALPFLTGILMSGTEHAVPGRSAALAAGPVFCGLLAARVFRPRTGPIGKFSVGPMPSWPRLLKAMRSASCSLPAAQH